MFRLEKIFQNDDIFFIKINILCKTILILFSIYIYSILEFNTIYDLLEINIYKDSNYYFFSIYITVIYFFVNSYISQNKKYRMNFLSYLRYDILPLIISIILCFFILFLLKINLRLNLSLLILLVLLIIFLFVINKCATRYYNFLIESNIIQRNIMLVGNFEDIKKIIKDEKENINIYKCCLVQSNDENEIKRIRSEIKIPIFNQKEDIRSILEYHSLGQVWILDNKEDDISIYLKNVLKYSVDILIINLKKDQNLNLISEELINDKYKYIHYEISKFYGFNLFIKILTDKILSLIFLTLLSPVILISIILIYLEDGKPIFFTQDRTGWDGRRFKIFKLRSLKKEKFDKTVQVKNNDNRLLKVGKFIRRFSIDELPQFYNVLIGDMSIVGPRPHMVEHDIFYSDIFNSFLKRHKSSPGLTGWAQLNGFRGETPTDDLMRKRMEHDLWYLNNWSIWLDFYIILKTFYVVFKKPG